MGALSGGLDPESAVKLERKHHDHYWQKGWVVIEGVFRPDEADRVADAAVRIAEREQAVAQGQIEKCVWTVSQSYDSQLSH